MPRWLLAAVGVAAMLVLAGCAAEDGPEQTSDDVASSGVTATGGNDQVEAVAVQAVRNPATEGRHPHDRYVVATEDAPEAIGPYSQAVGAGDTLYLSGQIPMDPETGEILRDEDIATQTTQVLSNLEAVLAAEGLTMDDVVKTSVFLTDLDDFNEMNATYAEFFGEEPPARATVEVPRLPADVNVEISAVAYTGERGPPAR